MKKVGRSNRLLPDQVPQLLDVKDNERLRIILRQRMKLITELNKHIALFFSSENNFILFQKTKIKQNGTK